MYLYIFDDGKIGKTHNEPDGLDLTACEWGAVRIINMKTNEECINRRWFPIENLEEIS